MQYQFSPIAYLLCYDRLFDVAVFQETSQHNRGRAIVPHADRFYRLFDHVHKLQSVLYRFACCSIIRRSIKIIWVLIFGIGNSGIKFFLGIMDRRGKSVENEDKLVNKDARNNKLNIKIFNSEF